ncbi:hypothetical protein G6F42_019139 [Rhizopus arrhizus]|nr:hypothetical protein G6F42_019139 [Rhizopus arrhizus]
MIIASRIPCRVAMLSMPGDLLTYPTFIILQILLGFDIICHPDAEFTGKALDVSGSALLEWMAPVSSANTVVSTEPPISSSSDGVALVIPHLLSN